MAHIESIGQFVPNLNSCLEYFVEQLLRSSFLNLGKLDDNRGTHTHTWSIMNTQKQKSQGVRLGECVGQPKQALSPAAR